MFEIFHKQTYCSQFIQALVNLFKRFPLVVVASIFFTVGGVFISGGLNGEGWLNAQTFKVMERLLYTTCIGLPLLTALALAIEATADFKKRVLWQGIGVVVLLLYLFTHLRPFFVEEDSIQVILLTIAAYLLLFLPGVYYKFDSEKIWAWGKMLVARFLITFLYGVILFVGLIAALGATYFLFDLHFNFGSLAMSVWFLVVGIFGVWYFLIGIPLHYKNISSSAYPAIIKKLFYGILLPLLAIFTVILYVYMGKALYTWTWPKDGVAQWVLGYMGFAMVCFLLAYPLFATTVKLRRLFLGIFLACIPLFVVLFLGIGLRIAEYGFTINRLLVVLFGFWMLVAITYILSAWLKIKIVYVPLSLAALCLVASIGPWSIFNLAAYSQISRVEKLLVANGLLVNNHLVFSASNSVSREDQREIIGILNYLSMYHHLQGKKGWIDKLAQDAPYDVNWQIIQNFGWQW